MHKTGTGRQGCIPNVGEASSIIRALTMTTTTDNKLGPAERWTKTSTPPQRTGEQIQIGSASGARAEFSNACGPCTDGTENPDLPKKAKTPAGGRSLTVDGRGRSA